LDVERFPAKTALSLMPEPNADLRLEIAHILFIDVVGYSKLLMHEQSEVLRQLNQVVRNTNQFRTAEAAGKLIRIPAGDGMALVFFDNPEAPVRAAVEISEALQSSPQIRLRMGVHSGPVNQVTDVNDQSNLAGAGINIAQRVMDCGDAGHILLSKRVADDLTPFAHWRSQLHELGECEVKHGELVSLVSLYNDKIGNRQVPQKLERARKETRAPIVGEPVPEARGRKRLFPILFILLGFIVVVGALLFLYGKGSNGRTNAPPNVSAVSAVPEKSIAVLPFENLSKDEENAFFAGGMQDEILTDLARLADLKVISRTSVMKYKSRPEQDVREISKALGVAHILEGSVQRAANKVRVTAQLIDARTDTHLWADVYDRDLADVFAIQSEIAQKIVEQLKVALSPSEKASLSEKPTHDLQAYDDYLRAKEILRSTDLANGEHADQSVAATITLLESAVRRDPNFASAFALLAQANLLAHTFSTNRPPQSLARAETALQAARKLAPDAPDTYLASSLYYYYGKSDYDKALGELEGAARTWPNSADVFNLRARIERRLGRWTEAIRHFSKAAELDPRNLPARLEACQSFTLVRDYEEAIRRADLGIHDFPESSDGFRLRKANAALAKGDAKLAQDTLNQLSPASELNSDTFFLNFECALHQRDQGAAKRLLSVYSQIAKNEIVVPQSFLEGMFALSVGNREKAQSAFTEARSSLEALVEGNPKDDRRIGLLQALAFADAVLGRRAEALQATQRQLDATVDPLGRPGALAAQAAVLGWLGDKDRALDQVENLAKIPNGVSYGELRFHPDWDPLRQEPRFQKILDDLKPAS
jgi:TolB-like protein/class 3 adenylate cyclase